MVPRLAAQGTSFRGAYLYYFHDKDALSKARIAWTATINLLTDKVEKAWKVMAFTAKHQEELKEASGQKRSGAKLKKPVLAYSLSWHPEQKPDRDTMMDAAHSSLEQLGLGEHEAMVACHIDEPQPHLHIVVNKAHPRTGKVADLRFSKRKLQDWAREFQRKEGTMYCPEREKNHKKRQKGEPSRYGDPKIIEAWDASKDGRTFQAALKDRGYDLAQGRKRLVVVDPYGKTLNPVRMLPEVKAAEFATRVRDLDPKTLPTPDEILKVRQREQAVDHSLPTDSHEEKADIEPIASPERELLEAFERVARRHQQEWQDSALASRSRVVDRKASLISHYKIKERRAAIAKINEELAKPTLIPKFARRLLKLDREKEERLKALKNDQREARKRVNSAIKKLEEREGRMLKTIEKRHAREMNTLCQKFGSLVKTRDSRESKAETKQRDQAPEITWHDTGPEMTR